MPPATSVRVLIIDDDREDAKLVSDLLGEGKRAKFAVEKAETADAGLTKLEESKFDVVLLDYKLPDLDGLSFLKRIYEELYFKIPVVIITSHGDRSLQARAIEAGAAEYLEKGTFNTEILERTCIYAIGLYEKQTRNGSGPGVGVNIETLVSLTRESVIAQTHATEELKASRAASTEQSAAIRADIRSMRDAVLSEVRDISRFRWLLDWIKSNPIVAIVIFLCLVTIAVLAVILINSLDPATVEALKATTLLRLGGGGIEPSCSTG